MIADGLTKGKPARDGMNDVLNTGLWKLSQEPKTWKPTFRPVATTASTAATAPAATTAATTSKKQVRFQ